MILERRHASSSSERKMDHKMSSKKRSRRLLLLVLALGMAMACAMLLGKLREGRLFSLMLREQDQQILKLQLLLQRERVKSKAIKRKMEDFQAKNLLLRTQKTQLSNKLMETQTAADHLQKMQNEMEASLEEKQNQIKSLTEKAEESNLKVADLSELLKQKEAKVEDAKKQFEKLSTNPTEGREANDENDEKNERDEETPKEGKWVKLQTNGDGVAAEHDHNEKTTFYQGSTSEIKRQSEELITGEAQEDGRGRKNETHQESPIEIKEASTERGNDQRILNNMEQKEMAAEREKPATPREPTMEAEGKEHKVRRNKNRGKGRRRRATPRGREYDKHIKEDKVHASIGKNEFEGERKEIADETVKLEILETSQIDGSTNSSQGQINSEARTEDRDEMASTKGQSEKSGNPTNEESRNESKEESSADSESTRTQTDIATAAAQDESSEVHEGDGIDKNAGGEAKEITPTNKQSGTFENPQEDEAKDESTGYVTRALADLQTEKESDAEKQVEEDGGDLRVNEGKETTSTKEQTQEPENPKEDEIEEDDANEETGASVDLSTEKESDAEQQDRTIKAAADVSTTQMSEGRTNADDSSSEYDTKR